MAKLPNAPLDDVPSGIGEADNVEIRRVGELPCFDFDVKDKIHIYSTNIDKAPIGGETYTEYYDSTLFSNIS